LERCQVTKKDAPFFAVARSALGQMRRFRHVRVRSALPPKATVERTILDRQQVPNRDIDCRLINRPAIPH